MALLLLSIYKFIIMLFKKCPFTFFLKAKRKFGRTPYISFNYALMMNSVIINTGYDDTNEGIIILDTSTEESVAVKYKVPEEGGIIVMSTALNAADLDKNKLKHTLETLVKSIHEKDTGQANIKKTFWGDTSKDQKCSTVAEKVGYSVGQYMTGGYRDINGLCFNKDSISIEIVGVSSKHLFSIAQALCKEFGQESAMVSDYARKCIYLADC